MPLLNIFCFFTLVFLYWTDKYLVLNHYKRPPRYTQIFNDRILTILPYALLLHCAFALYSYGSESIYPTGFHKETNDKSSTEFVVADEEDI